MSASSLAAGIRRGAQWVAIVGVCGVLLTAYVAVGSAQAIGLTPGYPGIGSGPVSGTAYVSLKVPSQYPTIQSAIDAASPGSTIAVAMGTYTEQITIAKSVNLLGAGSGRTIIQSPTNLKVDPFGLPWTLEVTNGAVVTMSGFTVRLALQCIPAPTHALSGAAGYAAGGIGVGGGASFSLAASAITTGTAVEGGACNEPSPAATGTLSYGTAIAFGLDYALGAPTASQLAGYGTVSGTTISGFGYDGASVLVGGWVDSAAGSHAVISYDQIQLTPVANPTGHEAGVVVGASGHSSAVTVANSVIIGGPGTNSYPVVAEFGGSAFVQSSQLVSTGGGSTVSVLDSSAVTLVGNQLRSGTGLGATGIEMIGSTATIEGNTISGPSSGGGIVMLHSSAVIEGNLISQYHCALASAWASLCGPSGSQLSGFGIYDANDAGLGTAIVGNIVNSTDRGIFLYGSCPACVVQGNILLGSTYYGLGGEDGTFAFAQGLVSGGMYGVAAIAHTIPTTVTVTAIAITGTTTTPYYLEVDFGGGSARIVGS